jgi:acyl-lipid (7-3)-desaturase (Delta-4 desaturase)
VDWIHQHVVQHHINTNDVHEDPDIEGGVLLRLNPIKKIMEFQAMQHIYVFVLLAFFGFSTVLNAVTCLWKGVRFTPMSKLVKNYRYAELVSSIFFAVRWIVLPLLSSTPLESLVCTAPLYVVAGYYLAFFFILSHNYEGAHMYDKTKKPEGASFLRNQVLSSSNVAGSWLCFFNGGLNYQIEHHLFPRINHMHYPTIAPLVKIFCATKGIRYTHFPTIWDNFKSCSRHLQKMSKDSTKPLPGH